MTTRTKPPDKFEIEERLKRFRYNLMDLEYGQTAFSDLHDTRFYECWREFCTHTYHARCALQKLQRQVEEAKDVRWYEEDTP